MCLLHRQGSTNRRFRERWEGMSVSSGWFWYWRRVRRQTFARHIPWGFALRWVWSSQRRPDAWSSIPILEYWCSWGLNTRRKRRNQYSSYRQRSRKMSVVPSGVCLWHIPIPLLLWGRSNGRRHLLQSLLPKVGGLCSQGWSKPKRPLPQSLWAKAGDWCSQGWSTQRKPLFTSLFLYLYRNALIASIMEDVYPLSLRCSDMEEYWSRIKAISLKHIMIQDSLD